MKPPCMFDQAIIRAASASGGARPRSRAARSPALQAAANGSASKCGRASRLAVMSPKPSPTVAMSGVPRSSRAALSPTISAALAAAAPVMSTTPLQPPRRKASVMRISDSHSCAVHGAPGIEWLNGSAHGTARCAMIHSPVAKCDQVSPSPKTLGEKVDSANRKIAIAAKPSPVSEAPEASSLRKRTIGKAMDMPQACQGRNNAALKRRPPSRSRRLPAETPSVWTA